MCWLYSSIVLICNKFEMYKSLPFSAFLLLISLSLSYSIISLYLSIFILTFFRSCPHSSYSILSCPILPCTVMSCLVQCCPVSSSSILSPRCLYSFYHIHILSYFIQFLSLEHFITKSLDEWYFIKMISSSLFLLWIIYFCNNEKTFWNFISINFSRNFVHLHLYSLFCSYQFTITIIIDIFIFAFYLISYTFCC